MLSAFIEGYGEKQIVQIGDVPAPRPGPYDVLVRIHAASVNPVDFKLRNGNLRLLRPHKFPLILGHDCAGEIIEVGELVSRFKVGDRIFSRPRNGRIGTFAEMIAIDQSEIAPIPPNLAYEEAASLPLVGLTSWQALLDVAHLTPRQKVLIHAGSGGIGTFAIQLAKHVGAEVWTTTSGRNVDFVKGLGADHVINYQTEQFEDRISNMDVVFDTLGGRALHKSFAVTRPDGWVISIAGSPNYRTAQALGLRMWKFLLLGAVGMPIDWIARRAGVNYRFIFMRSSGDELARIAELVARGIIKPVIDRTFPLSGCQPAIEYSESGKARGKIVIRMRE